MTVVNDKLYSVYRDAADVITLTTYNGENWSQPVGIRGPANQLVRGASMWFVKAGLSVLRVLVLFMPRG
ncbi:hypothetical protein ACLGI4_00600 [Streptomyces sp. HMX112]|uniref:hypothetical protein n=1 Tax=Streptomyces sp. HMX112 TaxID=3390850 RepID=UPI003A8124D9